jgi:hypothetical protein
MSDATNREKFVSTDIVPLNCSDLARVAPNYVAAQGYYRQSQDVESEMQFRFRYVFRTDIDPFKVPDRGARTLARQLHQALNGYSSYLYLPVILR